MEDRIKEILKAKRNLEAEGIFIRNRIEDQRYKENPQLLERRSAIGHQLANIESWLTLLSEDERYVIQRHLIDGIDIPRVAIEYRERWGDDYAKTDRTIKSYQRRALQKIARFEKAKKALINGEHADNQ